MLFEVLFKFLVISWTLINRTLYYFLEGDTFWKTKKMDEAPKEITIVRVR